jgi:L-seryl-tRNA(Ser) seleniumtransferase
VTDASLQARLRQLPAVDKVVEQLRDDGPVSVVTSAARRAVDEARDQLRAGGEALGLDDIADIAKHLLRDRGRMQLGRVINATGVLIHTNLGRAPLGKEQLDAVQEVASSYTNLEYDTLAGARGSRYSHAAPLLIEATGGEDALVVNNNAAAVLLVLSALCRDKEVIISRGELIEIGGEFRIPEVMSISGAELVEVGTTNRTHLADYEKAISQNTGAIVKVHPSNYKVVGFTAGVEAKDLARLARGRGVPLVHDLGSGLLRPQGEWTKDEPIVSKALEDGADVVTFSGDKLLGGPQAGLIVGRKDLVEKLRNDALVRALRVDKMTLAALEATLRAYIDGREHDLPLWAAVAVPADDLRRRADALAEAINTRRTELRARAVSTRAVSGGGSLPGAGLESWAVGLSSKNRSSAEIERALRAHDPPIVSRVEGDEVLLDLRTVGEDDDPELIQAVVGAEG